MVRDFLSGFSFARMNATLRTFGVYVLTSLLMLRTLVVPVILVDFELRHDYIAQYLCENRLRPELHCDGKCYLAKKLKAAQEHDEREASQRLVTQLLELPHEHLLMTFTFGLSSWAERELEPTPFLAPVYVHDSLSDCFRPPQAIFS